MTSYSYSVPANDIILLQCTGNWHYTLLQCTGNCILTVTV